MNETVAQFAYVWECPYCGTDFYREMHNFIWVDGSNTHSKELCKECLQEYIVVVVVESYPS